MPSVEISNWEGAIKSHPAVVVRATNVDEIVDIVRDTEKYPSPLRAVGSNHSTTRCGVADDGTVVVMTDMNEIVRIEPDSVTTQAGALYIEVAEALRKVNLQFFVNVEIGNLTLGSAACGGTKDASMKGEVGQVCSYCIGMKLVTPAGELIEVTEDDGELMQIMRSSYGLLGIVYEVTFRVQRLRPMTVSHTTYKLEEFATRLPELIRTRGRDESMMLYMFPLRDRITVEYRKYLESGRIRNPWRVWGLRNLVWKTIAPLYGYLWEKYMPIRPIRYFFIDGFNWIMRQVLRYVIRGTHTSPHSQTIRYPEKSGRSKYTFSIWAFPEEEYPDIVRGYFAFCKQYYREHGYRCNLLNVGYRIAADQGSLFSYSFDGNVLTLDPVSTGGEGWERLLVAYNEYCSERGGVPLFNQTKAITPEQARKAFGDRITKFNQYRMRYDPDDRLLNEYFRERFT